ncbi:MAG TPA: hypothetical protein VJN43_14875 [Bryobacteraceae bacterium]|nr:hypothetical protein [Bryobacteraceae bacterium]
MELLRGLESRQVPYHVEYRRTSGSCDGIAVRIQSGLNLWEVGFFDNDHIEVLRFTLAGDVEGGVTAASLLSELDALDKSR